MEEKYRAQTQEPPNRDAAGSREDEQKDDLARRRTAYDRPPLTKREQQDRWPIG